MATINEAATNALEFARSILGPKQVTEPRIEEVESTTAGGEEAWLITLSIMSPSSLAPAFIDLANRSNRTYKIFTVLKTSGEVIAMKIREIPTNA